MKTIKFHYVLGSLLFCFNSFVHSQCDIKFYKKQNEDLIFHSAKFTDSLQCCARVYLTYLINNAFMQNGGGITDIEISNIELQAISNNQKIRIHNCSDTTNQCICDTLSKYIRLYYNDPNRILTISELNALEKANNKYINRIGDVKIELFFSSIYIYPLQKTTKNQKKRLKYSNGS